jgi:CO/xanthine dehydrogenase FAD-binding subunit
MIDLQSIGLNTVSSDGPELEVGSMVTLTDFQNELAVPDILKDLCGREGPNTFRNAGTVGGTVATGSPDSELLAGFLAFAARVTLARAGGVTETLALEELLSGGASLDGAIITSVTIDSTGQAAAARTGRTPADTSIVAVVGRRVDSGSRLAATGVAGSPILIDPAHLDALDPPGDFRGSSEYRRHLAGTLVHRVLEELGEHS